MEFNLLEIKLNSMADSDILFVLNLPPPYGGGEILNSYLYEKLNRKYNFILISRKNHNKSKQGRLLFSNIYLALKIIVFIILVCVRNKIKILFLGIPKEFFPFLRTSLIIHIVHFIRIKIIGDLHGMGFNFLTSKLKEKYLYITINKLHSMRVLSCTIASNIYNSNCRTELKVIDNGIAILNQ